MDENKIDADIEALELLEAPKLGKNVLLIDLNAVASPAVLSGLFGCNVQMIYQYRQDGKLPPNTNATYAECILQHTKYWKLKSVKKASNVAEAALMQKIQLDRAKTEQTWLAIAKERRELVDTQELAMLFEPFFTKMRGQLMAVTRKYPETAQMLDGLLGNWNQLGREMLQKGSDELENFIEEQMNQELDLDGVDDGNSED